MVCIRIHKFLKHPKRLRQGHFKLADILVLLHKHCKYVGVNFHVYCVLQLLTLALAWCVQRQRYR